LLRKEAAVPSGLHERLVSLFAEVFQTELDPAIDDIARPELEAWDSINHFRLVSELEQTFDITLSDHEVLSFASLKDIETLLIRRGLGSLTRH
jgi:acyl carrier protein